MIGNLSLTKSKRTDGLQLLHGLPELHFLVLVVEQCPVLVWGFVFLSLRSQSFMGLKQRWNFMAADDEG